MRGERKTEGGRDVRINESRVKAETLHLPLTPPMPMPRPVPSPVASCRGPPSCPLSRPPSPLLCPPVPLPAQSPPTNALQRIQ